MPTKPTLPDEVTKRPLHFFYLVDASGSMTGAKINSLEDLKAVAAQLCDHAE